MECIRLENREEGVEPLLDRLVEELTANRNVLWLVSGGSNIAISVEVMNQISVDQSSKLSIYLTDERYGEMNHAASNAKQLRDAGFDPKQARFVEVLTSAGLSLEETSEQYSLSLSAAFEAADVVIAQPGIGTDGHILGVLPGTVSVDSDQLVVGYVTDQFTRVTLTLKGFKDHVDAAYVFAFGENKREQLADLLGKDLPLDQQPAQILKQIPEAYVYNDLIEGEA